MKLTMGLSASSVRNARRQLFAYRKRIPERLDRYLSALAEIGVDAAVVALESAGRSETGELANSIRVEKQSEHTYLVVTDCWYAAYVEFGTGVVGARKPYPMDYPAGIGRPLTQTKKHTSMDGSWVYFDERQGGFFTTYGQMPAAFMATADAEMIQSVARLAKEVFFSD